jgi:poly-gamma-glutamate synthase PgsB/CapB
MLLRALLDEHVTPLQRKVRGHVLDDLAARLVALEPREAELPDALRLGTLAVRATQVVKHIEDEVAALDRRFGEFRAAYLSRSGDRRDLVIDYLAATVPDPRARRADIRALRRFLDFDVLRERHTVARHRRLVVVEIALTFAGRAAAAALVHRHGRPADSADELFGARFDAFLRARAEKGDRWQVRHAALDAFIHLLRAVQKTGSTEAFERDSLGPAVRIAGDRDEHPFVQGAAVELATLLAPRFSESILAGRLFDLPAELPRHDFLVRRHIVDLLGRKGDAGALALLDKLARRRDPSEHVRLGVAEALGRTRAAGAARALRVLVDDPSAKVRAAVAIAAVDGLAAAPDLRAERAAHAVDLLASALAGEDDPLPLRVACEEAARLVDVLPAPARADAGPRLLRALVDLSGRAGRPPGIHEAAADAAEAVARALDPARGAWTTFLGALAGAIAPGGRRAVDLAALPAGLPPLPEDPQFLGRILADLSRRDFGLAATRAGDRLDLWRGDRFKTRLWRVLHEARHHAPNKRQATSHVLGRAPAGLLRAPPGLLDEVTATVVPGERVLVDSEGGWGRHLPTVDDLLSVDDAPVRIYSGLGTTTLVGPSAPRRRLDNRLRLSARYADLARLRLFSLHGREPRERARYLAEVDRDFGIRATFVRHIYAGEAAPLPVHLGELYERAHVDHGAGPARAALSVAAFPFLHQVRDWVDLHSYYFLSPTQQSQLALALFGFGFAALFLAEAHAKRRRIERARRKIPLCIGGWGTRGKSGSERLKAALLHGLGYEVFVKTTGCEAMMIHSVPDEPPHELFIFRSYDKATIWEMRDTLERAAALGSEVYLWECMALTPQFVDLLQREWMRDDLVTITNAYPDHEDIQGPAGWNIAECIATFVPQRSVCITSEESFLPVFEEAARARGTRLVVSTPRDADLIADDLLALFPYKEHPRNIAMVARLGEELGIDRSFAIATMAAHVVPDIGVLKAYPPAQVRGRLVSFVNGMSANERTGFLNNWQRTGCDRMDPVAEPDKILLTVVNNRFDRVTRSEVFARILVEDTIADAHLLIGTNLAGLLSYIHAALAQHLHATEIVVADDLGDEPSPLPFDRLTYHLLRLRIPPADARNVLARLRAYARGASVDLDDDRVRLPVERLCAPGPDAPLALADVERQVADELGPALAAALRPGASPPFPGHVEVLAPATVDEVMRHAVRQTARIVVGARLGARLAALLAGPRADLAAFHQAFRGAYRELFLATVIVVDNPAETGDAIIDACARACPPGTCVTALGIQNIKGTGLDFVYRWLALDRVTALLAELAAGRRTAHVLHELETFEDHGLVDTGIAHAGLTTLSEDGLADADRDALARVRARMAALHREKVRALGDAGKKSLWVRTLERVERWLDPIDSVRRHRRAERVMKELTRGRISHARAAVELRKLYERQKGGWLASEKPGPP